MNNRFMWVIMFAVFATAFAGAAGQVEGEVLTVVTAGTHEAYPGVIADFEAETGAKVVHQIIDPNTAAEQLKTMIAADEAPDVYIDWIGRVAPYLLPEYALDLAPYMDDLGDFIPGSLEPFMRGKKLLGLPQPGSAQGMLLNVTLLNEIGYEMPSDINWSIEEFLYMCNQVKNKAPGKFGTALFAGNQSGDYLWMNWFYAFGGAMYALGDYSKTIINSPQSLEALQFLKGLYESGYVQPEAPVLNDDDYAVYWQQHTYAAMPWFPPWSQAYEKVARETYENWEPFEKRFVAFPNATGKGTPTYVSYAGIVAHKSKSAARNRLIARLAWYFTSPDLQKIMMEKTDVYPNRLSVEADPTKDRNWMEVQEIVARNGVIDLGNTLPQFGEIRPIMYPLMQKLYKGEMSPQEVLDEYERAVNAVLSD